MRAWVEKILVIPAKEEVYQWQRFFKKDLGTCALKNEKEIAELEAQIAVLTEENREQRRLLSSPLPKNWQFLAVKVIGLDGEVLTINRGKGESVKEGMVAISGSTFLGKVNSVSEEMAQIRLPSFPEERLMVKIVAKENPSLIQGKGLLVGRGQGKMKIEQILAAEEVTKGNLVITNLESGDLLVGEVEEVMATKGEVFKTSQVKRFFNPEELETIFLVKGKI